MHQRFPKPSPGPSLCNLLRNPLNLTWLCTKASWNLLPNPVELTWLCTKSLLNLTWLCIKGSRNLLRTFSGTHQTSFSGTSLNLTRRLHQSLPDLLRNLRNLLPNLVESDPACTNSYSGLKTPLAYTVGEKAEWYYPRNAFVVWKKRPFRRVKEITGRSELRVPKETPPMPSDHVPWWFNVFQMLRRALETLVLHGDLLVLYGCMRFYMVKRATWTQTCIEHICMYLTWVAL